MRFLLALTAWALFRVQSRSWCDLIGLCDSSWVDGVYGCRRPDCDQEHR